MTTYRVTWQTTKNEEVITGNKLLTREDIADAIEDCKTFAASDCGSVPNKIEIVSAVPFGRR